MAAECLEIPEHHALVERQETARELFGEPRPVKEEPATLPGPNGMEWGTAKVKKI